MTLLLLALATAAAQEPVPRVKFPELRSALKFKEGEHLKKIPDPVQALDNKWVAVSGYTFLRMDGDEIREILVTETMFAQGVGARPSVFNWVKVQFRPGARPAVLTQGAPILLSGRFVIRKEGRLEVAGEQLVGLYHLVEAVEGEVPNPDKPVEAVRTDGVRAVTFATLETAKGVSQGTDVKVPPDIEAMSGRWVTITGNVLVPWAEEKISSFVLAKNPWDGCCLGVPPTIYDSVTVRMKEGTILKDRYSPVQTISGRFRIELEKKVGYVVSLYKLEDAIEGAVRGEDSRQAGTAPGFPIWAWAAGAAVALTVIVILAGRGRRRTV